MLPRFDGPTLQQQLLTRAVTYAQVGEILAALYLSVHKTPPPPNVSLLRDWIASSARASIDVTFRNTSPPAFSP